MITTKTYKSDDGLHFNQNEEACLAYESVLKQYPSQEVMIKEMEELANEKFNDSLNYHILIGFNYDGYSMNFVDKHDAKDDGYDFDCFDSLDRENLIYDACWFMLDEIDNTNFRDVKEMLEHKYNIPSISVEGEWSK